MRSSENPAVALTEIVGQYEFRLQFSPGRTNAVLILIVLISLASAHGQTSNQQSLKTAPAAPQTAPPAPPVAAQGDTARVPSRLLVTVVDENGVALAYAQVRITNPATQKWLQVDTDFNGAYSFFNLPAGTYEMHVEKGGFYQHNLLVTVSPNQSLEVELHHVEEYRSEINVTDSPPTVDPERTAEQEEVTNREIFSLPYPTTRDYRNVLPFLPGVIEDANGQIHVGGSATYQILDVLDGFNMTQPASGLLELRVSTDAIRQINLESSRYSVEYGKSTGGVLSVESLSGDDHYRFLATNFIPGLNFRNGVNLDNWNWTPRVNFSGPIAKGKAWFFEGADGEYDKSTIIGLPTNGNVTTSWRMSSLSKVQVNLTPSDILTGSFLINRSGAGEANLSAFNPLASTFSQSQSAYLASLKNSVSLPSGAMLELGVGVTRFSTQQLPQGTLPYVLTPTSASGNYYLNLNSRSQRVQGIGNVYLPPLTWHGRHDFRVGTDIDALTFNQSATRSAISILNTPGAQVSQICFGPAPCQTGVPINASLTLPNYELGSYAQDRWSIADRLVVETGVRFDRDHIVRQWITSPRLAGSYMLQSDTKIDAGIGLYYDQTNLALVSQPFAGFASDQIFVPGGVTTAPILFLPSNAPLRAPRFVNWSLGVEHKLPKGIYGRVDYQNKRGMHEFTYVNAIPNASCADVIPNASCGTFRLSNAAQDRFHSVLLTGKKQFKGNYEVMVSYMRSSARSNAVVNWNLNSVGAITFSSPLLGVQSGGPLPWDAPNRFISWGWAPLSFIPHLHKFDLAYSAEYHTGLPFSAVNQYQALVGAPDSYRFPAFFTLNMHLERRIRFKGYDWALRAGFNNITNRDNPGVVNNVLVNNSIGSSPQFLRFSDFQHRSFTARIRLLGRY